MSVVKYQAILYTLLVSCAEKCSCANV